jgi:sulfide:quinone oxidoreductase
MIEGRTNDFPRRRVFAKYLNEQTTHIAREIIGKRKRSQFDANGECFIETGDGKAGLGGGNFYAEPLPQVKIQAPSRRWHAAKVVFEKDWLRRWF